jgi:Tfp pilus assembly ATPase PilU
MFNKLFKHVSLHCAYAQCRTFLFLFLYTNTTRNKNVQSFFALASQSVTRFEFKQRCCSMKPFSASGHITLTLHYNQSQAVSTILLTYASEKTSQLSWDLITNYTSTNLQIQRQFLV